MTEPNETEVQDSFKIVTVSYTEQASIVVKAETDEEATEAVHESFSEIKDLKIISIEEAPSDLVAEVKQFRKEENRTLN